MDPLTYSFLYNSIYESQSPSELKIRNSWSVKGLQEVKDDQMTSSIEYAKFMNILEI